MRVYFLSPRAGFIGSNSVLDWIVSEGGTVVNLDKLTYADNLADLGSLRGDTWHVFVQGDIGDRDLVRRLLREHRPRTIVNFAAESHVHRSIYGPEDFVQTNVTGMFRLLEEALAYFAELQPRRRTLSVSCLFHRRGLWLPGPAGATVYGDDSLRAEQSLCRLQGGFASPRACLSPLVRCS